MPEDLVRIEDPDQAENVLFVLPYYDWDWATTQRAAGWANSHNDATSSWGGEWAIAALRLGVRRWEGPAFQEGDRPIPCTPENVERLISQSRQRRMLAKVAFEAINQVAAPGEADPKAGTTPTEPDSEAKTPDTQADGASTPPS